MNINDIAEYLEDDKFVPKFILSKNQIEITHGVKYNKLLDCIHSNEIYVIISNLYVDSMTEYFECIKDDLWALIGYEMMDNTTLSNVCVYLTNEDNIRKANRKDRFVDIFISKLKNNYSALDAYGLQFEIIGHRHINRNR